MHDNPNRPVGSSTSLLDLIGGFAGCGGTDGEVRRDYERYFEKNPDLKPVFMSAYIAMMRDGRFSFSDKCAYFIQYPGLDEGNSRRILCDIWELATGDAWTDQ